MQNLLIIRHGETEWNHAKRWQGWLDSPLTDRGLQQAHERAAALVEGGFAPAVVHSSDLERARRTAEVIAFASRAEVRTHHGLRERSGGDWEGFTSEEIDERWPGKRDAWRNGEITTMPGGEDDKAVFARFDAAIADALAGGTPALVITHGGVLRLVATRAGVDIDTPVPNLSGFWFSVEDGKLTSPVPLDELTTPTEAPAVE